MLVPEIISFQDALEIAAEYSSKKHLLLGNGFSISCRPDIFHYASLYTEADFSKIPEIESVFEGLETQDFEHVIKTLENTAKLVRLYSPEMAAVSEKMGLHASTLKEVLISTVAQNHPALPSEIEEEKLWACREFLSHFIGNAESKNNGYVFTLNYDLLLYWTLMNEGNPFAESKINLEKNDGFGNEFDNHDAEYVVWQGDSGAHGQTVVFLHGALHLFDAGSELQKFTWVRSGLPLIDQIRSAMDENKFPIFVSEGSSQQKKDKIRHNAYLYQGSKFLNSNANQVRHCFFIFGHSLADNDDHILLALARGKFRNLFISIYGDSESLSNQEIISKAERLKDERSDRYPLDIYYYDADSANVWGTN